MGYGDWSGLGGAGGDGGEAGEGGLGEVEELGGGDGGEGVDKVGGEAFVDIGGNHLAVAFGDFEGAVDAADEVAHHDVADTVELGLGYGLLAQEVDFVVDLCYSVGGALRGHVGSDEKDDAVAEYLCLAVDAVGVAFVFAEVGHET